MAEQAPVAAIVLAAGFSRRLGRPKQTIVVAGEMLLVRAAKAAREAGFGPILAIVHAELTSDAAFPRQQLEDLGCVCVVNRDAVEGMASSIRCGIDALQGHSVAGAIFLTCDQVAVMPSHLQALAARPEDICASGYGGRTGVPAYFPQNTFASLLKLRGDQGARELLRGTRVVTSEDLMLDVDSEEDVRAAERWITTRRQ